MKNHTKILNFALIVLLLQILTTSGFSQYAKIGDYVWEDTNQNGIQDAGEPPIPGVTILLYNQNGEKLYENYSDYTGRYLFTEVPPGNYYMEFNTNGTQKAYEPTVITGSLADPDNNDVFDNNGKWTTDIFTLHAGDDIDYIDAGFYRLYCEPGNNDPCADLSSYDLSAGGTLPDEQTTICSYAFLTFLECDIESQTNAVFYTFTLPEDYNKIRIKITPSGTQPVKGIIVAALSYPNDDFCTDDICLGEAQCKDAGDAEFVWKCLKPGVYQLRISTSNEDAGTFMISSQINKSEDSPCAVNNKCENAMELKIEETCTWNDFTGLCNADACPDNIKTGKCDLSKYPTVWYKFKIPADAQTLDIDIDNSPHDFILFDEENACTSPNGICGHKGVLHSPVDITGEDGKYYYLAVTGEEGEFDIHIRVDAAPENNNPCMSDPNPPYDLGVEGTHHGTTCCATGTNTSSSIYNNLQCSEDAVFNTVWYRATIDTVTKAMHISVEDVNFDGIFGVEVYSGGKDAICEENARFLTSRCNEFPGSDIKLNFDCIDDEYVFIKISSSEPETKCANFTISVESIDEENYADKCSDITEMHTLTPVTPGEFELNKYCTCSTLGSAHPEDNLNGGCADFDTNPTVWFKVVVDSNASQLFSYVTTDGNWTPVWSVYYSETGDCEDIVNVADSVSSGCSKEANPPAPPLISLVKEGIYYIAVSSQTVDIIDNPDFELCVATLGEFDNVCQGDNTGCPQDTSLVFEVRYREFSYLEPEGPPYSGPFYPGEKLGIHLEYFAHTTLDKSNVWFNGLFPKFGNSWNLDSFDFAKNPPCAKSPFHHDGRGKWYESEGECAPFATEDIPNLCLYRDGNGKLQFCNMICEDCQCQEGIKKGDYLPSGYFWVLEGSAPACSEDECSPSYKYGIGTTSAHITWDFELEIKEFENNEDCLKNPDLSISFITTFDGNTGCWDDPNSECSIVYTQFSPQWEINCNTGDTILVKMTKNTNQCYGDCNGSFVINEVKNASLPVKFKWSTGDTTNAVSGLCKGEYTVTIEDAEGKILIATYEMTAPSQIVSNISATGETKPGGKDGTAMVKPSGGYPPYTAKWNVEDSIINNLKIENLAPGIYYVTVTDCKDCSIVDSVQVPDFANTPLELIKEIQNPTCHGDCDGKIEITKVKYSTPPLKFTWSTGDTVNPLTGLCSGSYMVTVVDSTGKVLTDTFKITSPDSLISNITATAESSIDANDGTASVNPEGGVPPYSIIWSTGDSVLVITNLAPGLYHVTITDEAGCSIIDSAEVKRFEDMPLALKSEIQNATCYGECNGKITIKEVENAALPLSYKWSTGDTTGTVAGLCAGIYTVTVEDFTGKKLIDTFAITSPSPIISNITATDETAYGSRDGTASVNPGGGIAPYKINWSTGDTTPVITNLEPGIYYVTITDSVQCSITDSATVSAFECPASTVNSNIKNATCFGDCDGEIEITEVENAVLPLTYRWNTGDTTKSIHNLCKGLYTVTVTDVKNCETTDTFEITEPDEIIIAIDSLKNIDSPYSGSISISTNDNGNYSYSWSGPCDFASTNEDIDSLNCEGCYELTVLDTLSGCQADTTICITYVSTDDLANEETIRIYPNPAEDYVIVNFIKSEPQAAKVELYNLAGTIKAKLHKDPDKQTIRLNTKPLTSGVYILKIEQDKRIYYKKVVIAR